MSGQRDMAAFVGYDYLELPVDNSRVSLYLDCYRCFGWQADDNLPQETGLRRTTLRLKRDRKLAGHMELTRLQRHFEACARQLQLLERRKRSVADGWAITVGLVGTAFMAGSTFAVTHSPPIIWLCVLLAIPGFLGWALPWLVHRHVLQRQTEKLTPLIEAQYAEAYAICEKGSKLL